MSARFTSAKVSRAVLITFLLSLEADDRKCLGGVAVPARRLAGIRFYPISFTPRASKYANEECHGVFMVITNRTALQPVRVGFEIASALFSLYGAKYEPNNMWRLIGSEPLVAAVQQGEDPGALASRWSADEARWRRLRAKYLLYR